MAASIMRVASRETDKRGAPTARVTVTIGTRGNRWLANPSIQLGLGQAAGDFVVPGGIFKLE